MPEATIATFNLSDKSPAELENRRREIIAEMTTKYRGYDDPDVPEALLTELAVVAASLRKKNSGPPKAATAKRTASKTATTDDLVI